MQMYYRVINDTVGEVQVYFSDNPDFVRRNGFIWGEVEQCKTSGRWYLAGMLPTEEQARDRRAERDNCLALTDKYMLADYPITAEQREIYKTYRKYLRDLPAAAGFPAVKVLSFGQWKGEQNA